MATTQQHSPANARQDEARKCCRTMQKLLGSLAVHLPAEHPVVQAAFLMEFHRAAKAHAPRQHTR